MPKVKGSGVLGRPKAQPPIPPQRVTMSKRYRQKGFGDTVKPVTTTNDPDFVPAPPSAYERDLMILQAYKREMRLCDERACECTCHCHAGPGECYLDTSEGPALGHSRTPNEAHKRAHRECPKGDSHKW